MSFFRHFSHVSEEMSASWGAITSIWSFKHLSLSSFTSRPLIEIAAVCSGKVRSVIDNRCALAFEKFVQLQIGLCVNGVSKSWERNVRNMDLP